MIHNEKLCNNSGFCEYSDDSGKCNRDTNISLSEKENVPIGNCSRHDNLFECMNDELCYFIPSTEEISLPYLKSL